MKKQNMFGAIALSAALALGTAVPAFAATATVDDAVDTMSGNGGSGETVVKAYVVDSQISATVPVALYVVTPDKGGTLTCPTNYAITNTGEDSVEVAKVEATGQGGWDIANTKTYVTATTDPSTQAVWPSDVDKQVKMDFKTVGAEFSLVEAAAGKALTLNINSGEAAEFTLSGTSNVKNPLSNDASMAQAMAKLTYTLK